MGGGYPELSIHQGYFQLGLKTWGETTLVDKSKKYVDGVLNYKEEDPPPIQGFQSGPVPGTFTRLRSCIVPAEITEPPKISGGQNHKYDGR